MVGFPDSKTEPLWLNGQNYGQPDFYTNINDVTADHANTRKVKDEAFIIPRVSIPISNGNYTLKLDGINRIDGEQLSISMDSINKEPVLKEVVEDLKIPNDQKTKTHTSQKDKNISGGDAGGGGSLSCGSSIITISSVANSDPDPDPDCRKNPIQQENGRNVRPEKWYHTILQVAVPFIIAGVGTIAAGLILNYVKNWEVFKTVSQLLILVPALLGLKGNLDMCLASRLCTQANLGNMHGFREIAKMIIGNMALVQIQAIVAAVCVSLFAMAVGAITADTDNSIFVWNHALLLMASSVCTATSSCFILDFVLIAVIMLTYRFKINPDNVATPLAASFGDVVSISVLSFIAWQLFLKLQNEIWLLYLILGFYLLLLPCWIIIVLKNKYTRGVLKSGWIPVLSALMISGFGGLILDRVVDVYHGFAIFQPIINGIGGNLVSVQASRTSTMLHQSTIMGILPPQVKILVAPWTALFKGSPTAKTARMLIGMAIPGQLMFVFLADVFNRDNCMLHAYFVVAYVVVSLLQVMFLLYVAHIMIHAMWRYKIDPDNSAIPYLTALGDLSGSLFLALAFWFIYTIRREYCIEE